MFGIFKSRKSKQAPAIPTLLNVTIGRAVEVERLAYEFWPDDCLVELDSSTLEIVAQGQCDLGEGAHLHRFYPDSDSCLLQMQGGDGVDDTTVEEIVIWSYLDVLYPSSDAAWSQIAESIRQTKISLPKHGVTYDRVWFDGSTGPEDPITYWETVNDDLSGDRSRRIFQTAMLFGRSLSDGGDEMLLVNMEEPEDGDRCVSYMVGRSLTQHQIRA
jgi:hypothetical protein